jgi:ABC-type proline/glycine betaine transport system permease subunit
LQNRAYINCCVVSLINVRFEYILFRLVIMNTTAADHFQEFSDLSNRFGKYHLDHTNVLLHLITTPLGIIGFFSLFYNVTKSTSAVVTLCLAYFLSLLSSVPVGVFVGTAVMCACCVLIVRRLQLTAFQSMCVIIISYFGQDFAHWCTGEETFQGSYSNHGHVCTLPAISTYLSHD